jgi:AraC-like DNA-binding protein
MEKSKDGQPKYQRIENNDHTQVNITEIGHESCQASHSFGPAVRDYYLFHLVIDGKGVFQYENQEVALEKQQIFMIMPGEITYYEADKLMPWTYYWFGISGIGALGLAEMMGFGKDKRVVNMTVFLDIIVEKLRLFVDRRLIQRSDQLLEISDFYAIVSLICKNNEVSNDDNMTKHSHISLAIEYMKKNYIRQISVQDISDYMGIDRTQLFRLFKEKMDKGPQEYLIAMRIGKAEEMLKMTDLPVRIIAYSVGYPDPYHFSKLFKKKTGMSPSKYRIASFN